MGTVGPGCASVNGLLCSRSSWRVLVPGAAAAAPAGTTWAAKMVFVLGRAFVSRFAASTTCPSDSCVVVANHASYIDGVLLNGYLPARFGFVIKGELRGYP